MFYFEYNYYFYGISALPAALSVCAAVAQMMNPIYSGGDVAPAPPTPITDTPCWIAPPTGTS